MVFFISLIIEIIFIIFPSLLYTIYVANKQNLNEDINKIVLDISLITPLLFIILFNNLFINKITIVYIIILFLISLSKNRNLSSIIISIISIEFIHNTFDSSYVLLSSLFIINFIINFVFTNKNKTIIKYIFTSFILYFIYNDINIFLMSLSCLFISYYIIDYIINKSSKILELQNLLKEYKKESELKVSLFKITHEIKNPLSVVKGYLSMLNIHNKEKTIKYLSIINSEVERTINLLNDFMQFSKIEIKKETFKLSKVLDEVKNILLPIIETKKIKLNIKLESNIILNADYNRIKQVLINIIKNAAEASHINSSIDITCFINKNINIVIKDYGDGMDSETLENIFTPFYTTKEKGTGLGVSLSKEIIEAHKGKITYSSKLNNGTTVKIMLPAN